jgi:hypothetical protein
MMYFAIGLAALGTATGLAFRWKVLLPFIVLVPFATIIYTASRGESYQNAIIIVLVAEALLQGGYFVGLLIRALASAGRRFVRATGFVGSRPAPNSHDNDRPLTPPREAGKGS